MLLTNERAKPESSKGIIFWNAKDILEQNDIMSGCYFFLLNRLSFSGTTLAGGYSGTRLKESSIEKLKALPEALRGVKITNFDFQRAVQAPGDDVLLFIDPPYLDAAKLYGNKGELHEIDHSELASRLKRTPHKFLMTHSDCPEIRQLYHWADIQPLSPFQYGMGNNKKGQEVIIKNYA